MSKKALNKERKVKKIVYLDGKRIVLTIKSKNSKKKYKKVSLAEFLF